LRTCGRGEAFEGAGSIDCAKCVQEDELCVLWGDPHIVPFDREVRSRNGRGSNVNLYEYGDYWIVKSTDVFIQARYWSSKYRGNSMTRGLAVGGPFLAGNVLMIEPLSGQVMWNEEEILTTFPSTYVQGDLVYINYHDEAEVVRTGGKHKSIKGLDIMLPLGVRLTVNRHKGHLDVLVSMHQVPGGLDGHCGNFNGNEKDDTTKLISERIGAPVVQEEDLFTVKDYSFVGCYQEKSNDRDLTVPVEGTQMGDEECAMACTDHLWFGIQSGGKCWCGDTYGKHGEASNCNCEEGAPNGNKQCIYGYFDSEQPPENTLEDCDGDTLALADALCNKAFDSEEVESQEMRNLCKMDVCFGSPEFAEEDAWAAHVQLPCASVADVQRVCGKTVGSCADPADPNCDLSDCEAFTGLGWWDGEVRLLQDGRAKSDGSITGVVELEHRPGICATDSGTLEVCNAGQCSRKGGLIAQFFYIGGSRGSNEIRDFPDYNALTPDTTRIDAEVNYGSTNDAWPWGIAVSDYYAARWLGGIKITVAGEYTFSTRSDDGSLAIINGQVVVDNGGLHGMRTKTGKVTLETGVHGVQLVFWENWGGAGMIFSYSGPDTGGSTVVVPSEVLIPSEALGMTV